MPFLRSLCRRPLLGINGAKDKGAKADNWDFVPSPEFAAPYPPLPHIFHDSIGMRVLCRAPSQDAIQWALPWPLKATSDLFVLNLGGSDDVSGYACKEWQINTPIKWKKNDGGTTVIEYINSDMGLLAGRDIWGWPKKMADIVYTQTGDTWTMECYKQEDQDHILLMRIVFTPTASTPAVTWPVTKPSYFVKRTPNADPTVDPLIQVVCSGCVPSPRCVGYKAVTTVVHGTATVEFFDGPHDPLTFLGPVEVIDAQMSFSQGAGCLDLGTVVDTLSTPKMCPEKKEK